MTRARAQVEPEVVRGRIADAVQKPVQDAAVTVTGDRTQSVRMTRTDRNGRFTVLFLDGEARYTVLVRQFGFEPLLKVATRGDASNIIEVNGVLAPSPYPLPPIIATTRPLGPSARPERPSIGGMERNMAPGAQFLLDASDLLALAQFVPGVFALGDSGYSAMGASPEQNGALLDGMKFEGSILPPDAACRSSLAITTSDPSRGQFAGGQTSITSCRGRDAVLSAIRASVIEPALSWADPGSSSAAYRFGMVSGFVSGPLRVGMAHYHLSFSANDRSTDISSLLLPRATLLPQYGLSPDTLARLEATMNALGIPLTANKASSAIQARTGTALLTIDWNRGAVTSWLFTAYGALNQVGGLGLNQLSFPSSASQSSRNSGRVMLRGSTYLHGLVDDMTSAVSLSSSQSSPYLAVPGASVLVGTDFASGQTGLARLRFGGGASQAFSRTLEWNIRNQLSWIGAGAKHQVSFGQQLIADWNTSLQSANTAGAFAYQSLASLAANQPASYTRTLNVLGRANHSTAGALWVGDIWPVSRTFSVQGGLRLDAEHFGVVPSYNPVVDSAFGRRTDHIPSAIGLSPRFGFALLVRRGTLTVSNPRTGETISMPVGDVASATGQPRGNAAIGPGTLVTIFGGIGSYRGVIPPTRIASSLDRTGLPGTISTVSCVGDATPIPDWTMNAVTLPTACRDGSAPPAFSGNQTPVALIDPAFRAPVTWRANVGITGLTIRAWQSWHLEPSILISDNLNVESRVDLNLPRTPGFTLAAEADRPVFVAPEDIVPQTGVLAPSANRIVSQYGAVLNSLSDMHSTAVEFNITLGSGTTVINTAERIHIPFRLDYSLNWERGEQRGFAGTTAGNPFAVESSRGAQPVHQFILTPGPPNGARLWWFNAKVRLDVSSGQAFTPVVVGDINGDGLSNDRAFVPDPDIVRDTAIMSQMRALLAGAPAYARDCLESQLGKIAAANSCRGPWQARIDLNLDFRPPPNALLGSRLNLTLRFVNAGATLLRLLGISGSLTQAGAAPDGRLLYVTGFDPSAQLFKYRVNQLFGEPVDLGTGSRHFPPFQLQLAGQYQLARAPVNPLLAKWGLAQRTTRPNSRAQVRNALLPLATWNYMGDMLDLQDSLAMTPDQVRRISEIDSALHAKVDSLVEPLITVVIDRGSRLTDMEFTKQLTPVRLAIQRVAMEGYNQAFGILTPQQQIKYRAIRASATWRR